MSARIELLERSDVIAEIDTYLRGNYTVFENMLENFLRLKYNIDLKKLDSIIKKTVPEEFI